MRWLRHSRGLCARPCRKADNNRYVNYVSSTDLRAPAISGQIRALRQCIYAALGSLCAAFALAGPAAAQSPLTEIDSRTAGVLEFIGALEAPGGYDVVSSYAAAPPPKPLTDMTVGEVLDWQESIDARSKSEAAGRYQIMEDTLRKYLVPTMGLTGRERFSPAMQDAMAVVLMKRRGWNPRSRNYVKMGNGLAQEWAALPVLSGPKAGLSFYHDTKGARNRAQTTAAGFLQVLENPEARHVVLAERALPGARARRQLLASGIALLESHSFTRTRPASPSTMTGGALAPSRIIRFSVDPYAQN